MSDSGHICPNPFLSPPSMETTLAEVVSHDSQHKTLPVLCFSFSFFFWVHLSLMGEIASVHQSPVLLSFLSSQLNYSFCRPGIHVGP